MTELNLNQVYKAFPTIDNKINWALEDISLSAQENEFICIVGPSGCGKSTILRMIAGLIPQTRGDITLNGQEILEPSANIGLVFQNATLFPWRTVRDNIAYSQDMNKNHDDQAVNDLIELINLSGYEDYYPRQLSGGMAQRVSLARTMINQPEVFLLDEPLGALDAFTRANLQDSLLELWQNNRNLMIMVTHDVEEAVYMASKVVVMKPHPGRISRVVDIDMDYPRRRTSQAFSDYRREIIEELNF